MRKTALLCVVALTVSACGDDDNANSGPTKKDYDDTTAELATGIGVISIYRPYLDPPKADGKHDPRPTASDVQPRQEAAANAIRMAAHGARQRGKSPATKILADPLANVARSCTNARGDEAIKKCQSAVSALDVALEKLAKVASEAGATSTMPRIGAAAINDAAKKEFAPYRKALGPTPKEALTLKALEDPKADIPNLMMTCDAAAAEQEVLAATYEGVDEDLRKLAVKHQFAIEAICRIVKRVNASRAELFPCQKEKARKESACVLACSKAKGYVDKGMPAAAQESFPEYYKGICVEDEDD